MLIVIGFNIPNIIKSISGEETSEKLLIVDNEDIFEGSLEMLKQADLGTEIEVEKATFEEIKSKIENEEIEDAIMIERQENNVKIRYIVKDMTMMQEVPETIVNAINTLYTNVQISKLGLSQEQIQSITPNFEFSLEQTQEEKANGNIFAIMLMSIVLFYAIYFCAYQVSSSITTEKTSKIMETLVTSTKPSTIVLGKTIGIGLVGLLQIVVIAGTAIISAKAFLPAGTLENIFDMSNMTLNLGLITLLYFILGYFTYALLYALTGSMVSKPEDIQSANGPIAILVVIGFYLAYFSMMNPASNINQFAALMPFSSPFCMPLRVLMGITTTGELIASIAILAVTIFIIAKISIKVYSSAILNYGTKMNFKEIIKMCKNKND